VRWQPFDTLGAHWLEARTDRALHRQPDHDPTGIRAREALEARGGMGALQPFPVYGFENVTQAAQFALSGNARWG